MEKMYNNQSVRLLQIATVGVTHRAFLLPIAQHFRNLGWTVDGAACGIHGCEDCQEVYNQIFEIEWSRNPWQISRLLASIRCIRNIVNEGEYDIVHVHTPIAAFLARLAIRLLPATKRPVVIYTAHGFHFYKGASWLRFYFFLIFEKIAGYWTDYLIVINEEDEKAAKQFRIIHPEHVRYVPGIGVDIEKYSPKNIDSESIAKVKNELGVSKDSHFILMVAEFTPNKRHRDVLTVFKQISSRHKVILGFAGNGPLRQQMETIANELEIADRVHFLGFRCDIPVLIRAAAVTILVSEREGLPRSIMESLCLETPVIGTNIRGTRDLLKDGCGLLIKVGNLSELANAIMWVLEHPDDASAMGRKGRERMRAYDINHILHLYEALYAEALNQSSEDLVRAT